MVVAASHKVLQWKYVALQCSHQKVQYIYEVDF